MNDSDTPDKGEVLKKALKCSSDRKFRKPCLKDEKVKFLGEKQSKRAVQKELNAKTSAERVTDLTTQRRLEVIETLFDKREADTDDSAKEGLALYEEYRESVNADFVDENEDFFEAFWISSRFLDELYNQRRESDFWEDKRRPSN